MENNSPHQQQQGMGSQGEPFFELLQPGSAQNGPRRMDSHDDFDFKNDNVLPSYDFQNLRSSNGKSSASARFEDVAHNARQASPPSASYTSYEQISRPRDPPITYEKYESRQGYDKDAYDTATVAAVERTMKKYADNLLRALEGMSGRLSQLETATQRLEQSSEKSRVASADRLGEVDGEVRRLGNMVLEVQRGVQILRDKQEIAEAQNQLKMQQETKAEAVAAGKVEAQASPPAPTSTHVQVHGSAPSAPLPTSTHVQVHGSAPSAPLPAPTSTHVQVHGSAPPAQLDQTVVTPLPTQVAPPPQLQQQQQPHQQHQQHFYPPQASVPQPGPLQLGHQPLPQQQQQGQQLLAHQGHPSHQPEVPPYPPQAPMQTPHPQSPQLPSVNYDMPAYYTPPPPPPPPQQLPPPPQQRPTHPQYGPAGHQMYEQGRTGQLALPAPPPYLGQQQPQQYEAPMPQAGYSNYRVGGGGGYPQLPTAQPVQPSRTSQGSRPPSRSGVEDVIEKVAAMGFPREHVRSTVQRLTENGQAVDMNIVLDKLMNGGAAGGGDPEPQKTGWFGR